jgi:hypothetical protein
MLCLVTSPSRAETETLNLLWLPSLNRPTPTLHCYKKIISTLVTLLTTQSYLHFTSSLTRVQRHQSFTRRLTPIIHSYNDTHGDELANVLLLLRIAY